MEPVRAHLTDNFIRVLSETTPVPDLDILDSRHCIYARNCDYSLASYLGYLDISKKFAFRAGTRDSDYMLNLGFIPLVMPPSFWGDRAHDMILPKVQGILPCYPRPAMSFLHPHYRADLWDFWVSKMDAAELCQCNPDQVTTKEVLRRCGL